MQSTLWLICVLNGFLATYAKAGVQRVSRINGGASAFAGEFKYIVGIATVFEETISLCAGGIIDEKFILTAAHCLAKQKTLNDDGTQTRKFRKPRGVVVYANTTNLIGSVRRSGSELDRVVKRKAVKVYFVSEFFTSGAADIDILELESPFNLTNGYLRKLKLPCANNDSYENVQAVVAGFGVDNTGADDGTLKKAHFRVVPYSRCLRYPNAELYRQNSMCLISVTEDNKRPDHPLGACHGDSGSPLVRGNTVIGIMKSVAKRTCDGRDEYPQRSVKVNYYKKFINSVIGKLRIDQSITEFEL